MATTVEELLVSLQLDPASVTKFFADVDQIKARITGEPVNIPVSTNAQAALASAGAATGALRRQAIGATSAFRTGLGQVSAAASELRIGLLAVGAAAGFGLTQAIRLAAEESKNLAAANVILQVSQEELKEIQQDLRDVAEETGLTFQDVSASLFDVASAGFAADEALKVTTVAARVAAPANTDVATAFNSIATAMENFGFEADVAGDKLVRVADVSRASLGDLGDALGVVGPIAGQLGVSFEETGAALSQLTISTGNTAISATLLSGVLRGILTPSDDGAKAFKKLGIATGETAFQNQTLLEILQKIAVEGPRAGVGVTDLFTDSRAIRGALSLIANTDNIAKNINEIENSTGRTQQALNDFFQETGPQLDKLGAQFVNLLTTIGEDLLEALRSTIVFVTQFITNNKDLISTVVLTTVAIGALVLGIVALDFIVRQVSAAGRLLVGGLTVISEALAATTAAFATDTTAIGANALARNESAAATALATFLERIQALLRAETGVLAANALAWLRNGAARALDILGSLIARLFIVAQTIIGETLALIANTKALFLNVVGRKAMLAVNTPLSAALVTNIAALKASTVALGVLGAAFLGFELGSFINDVFGLSDAFGKFARTGERSFASVASEIAVFSNPITALIRGFQSAEEAAVKFESANLTAAQKAFLANEANRDIIDEVARIQTQNAGISRREALDQALNEQRRIRFLKELKQANKASAADITELARLEVALAAAIAQSESELGKLNRQVRDRAKLQDQLKLNEKDLAKVIKATNKEIIATRRGQEAATIAGARATFSSRIEILRRQANIEQAIAQDTQSEIEKLQARGVTGLAGLDAQLAKDQAAVARTLDLVAQNFEIFSKRIITEGQKRITALTQQADKEIAVARRRADEVIKQSQRLVDQATRELEGLKAARDQGVRDATAFLDRLRQEAIQRIDPALAELRRFEREALAGLTGATAAQAEAAIGLIVQRLKELAAATEAEVRIQEQLNRLREETAGEQTEEQITRSLREQEAAQEELTRLQQLRTVRAKAAEVIETRLNAAVKQAAVDQQKAAEAIRAEEQKILEGNQQIAEIKDLLAQKERVIQNELARTIRLQNILTQANIESLKLQRQLTEEVGKAGADTERAKSLASALKKAEENVKALERATAAELDLRDAAQRATERKTAEAFDALIESNKASIERDRKANAVADRLIPVADEATRLAGVVAESVEGVASSVDEVLKAQSSLGATTTNLATTTKAKLAQVGAEFARQDTRLKAVERELAAVRIAPEAEKTGGGL